MASAADAETAAAVAIRSAVATGSVSVVTDEPDRADGTYVWVHASSVEWTIHRDIVAMTATIRTDAARASASRRVIRDLGDQILEAVRTVDGEETYWAGPGSALAAQIEMRQPDTGRIASGLGSVVFSMVAEHVQPHEYAPFAQRVVDELTAAGIEPVVSADRGEFVVVREIGSEPRDARYDTAHIWACAPVDTGAVGALGRRCWEALYASDVLVPAGYGIQLATSGVPGCALAHDVAAIPVHALGAGR